VIFADFFRQIFAGGRVEALPFFQRRGIRQRDGENCCWLISGCPGRDENAPLNSFQISYLVMLVSELCFLLSHF
jgi:hypothetical protein